jgi:hypothetical protein
MKLYLAGKIGVNDWRHEIVNGLRNVEWGDEYDSSYSWGTLPGAIFAAHDYVGPYFVSDDHGCGHGPCQHGQALDGAACFQFDELPEARRDRVFKKCLHAIHEADVVFAWLDELGVYGSLFELGYAYSLGKELWVALPSSLGAGDCRKLRSEMWFAIKGATKFSEGSYNAKQALEEFLGLHKPDGYVYLLQSPDGHFKIGRSKDVPSRVRTLGIQLPYPVKLRHQIAVISDSRAAEKFLHSKFKDYRTNGEWFRLPGEAVAWLCSLGSGAIDGMMRNDN